MARRNEVPFTLTADNQTDAAFRGVRNNFQGLTRELLKFTAIEQSARQFGQFVGQTLRADAATSRLARRLGESTQAVSEYQAAARLILGTSDQLATGIEELQKRVFENTIGLGENAKAFRLLGLDTQKLINLSPLEAFEKTGRALAALENVTARNALSNRVFGESQRELVDLFQGSPEDLAALVAILRTYGSTLDDVTGAASERAESQILLLREQFTGLGREIGGRLVPLIVGAGTIIGAVATNVIDFGRGIVEFFANNVVTAIGAARAALSGDFLGALEIIRNRAVSLFESVRDDGADAIRGAFDDVVESVSAAFKQNTDAAVNALTRIRAGASAGLSNQPFRDESLSISEITKGFKEAIDLRRELLGLGGSSEAIDPNRGALQAARINTTQDPVTQALQAFDRAGRQRQVDAFLGRLRGLTEERPQQAPAERPEAAQAPVVRSLGRILDQGRSLTEIPALLQRVIAAPAAALDAASQVPQISQAIQVAQEPVVAALRQMLGQQDDNSAEVVAAIDRLQPTRLGVDQVSTQDSVIGAIVTGFARVGTDPNPVNETQSVVNTLRRLLGESRDSDLAVGEVLQRIRDTLDPNQGRAPQQTITASQEPVVEAIRRLEAQGRQRRSTDGLLTQIRDILARQDPFGVFS